MESVLIEGKNSYATLEAAEIYIRMNYGKYDPLRVIWSVLTPDERDVYMLNSMRELEALPVVGMKRNFMQKLQFPRRDDGHEIPEGVKEAQVENALGLIQEECANQSNMQFLTAQSLGMMQNIKFNRRTSANEATLSGIVPDKAPKQKRLTSEKAEQLLRPWFGHFRG